jgi:hypothetical protein
MKVKACASAVVPNVQGHRSWWLRFSCYYNSEKESC